MHCPRSPRCPRTCRWSAFPMATPISSASACVIISAIASRRARSASRNRRPRFSLGAWRARAGIFHAACERLGVAAECVLHVGDDPHLDVAGARNAGLRSAWLNRGGGAWSDGPAPDLEIRDLSELAAWILARSDARSGAQ